MSLAKYIVMGTVLPCMVKYFTKKRAVDGKSRLNDLAEVTSRYTNKLEQVGERFSQDLFQTRELY